MVVGGELMKKIFIILLTIILIAGCSNSKKESEVDTITYTGEFTKNTKIYDVINNESFKGYGRLIFPVDRTIDKNMTLENIDDIYIWYNYINPNKTVEIVNYMKNQVDAGNKIFYDIYTDDEKKANPDLENTGLFFFKGNPNEKFAIINAGGGMVYVGAMHDSFPHALELSKKGYNAFALIYRPGYETSMEDLARAVAFIHEHAEELEVDVNNYSLWGGSAGARIGSAVYGERAMRHLKDMGKVIYLRLSYESLRERLGDLKDRGVVSRKGTTLKELFDERTPLYEKYADIVIDENGFDIRRTVEKLRELIDL